MKPGRNDVLPDLKRKPYFRRLFGSLETEERDKISSSNKITRRRSFPRNAVSSVRTTLVSFERLKGSILGWSPSNHLFARTCTDDLTRIVNLATW